MIWLMYLVWLCRIVCDNYLIDVLFDEREGIMKVIVKWIMFVMVIVIVLIVVVVNGWDNQNVNVNINYIYIVSEICNDIYNYIDNDVCNCIVNVNVQKYSIIQVDECKEKNNYGVDVSLEKDL